MKIQTTSTTTIWPTNIRKHLVKTVAYFRITELKVSNAVYTFCLHFFHTIFIQSDILNKTNKQNHSWPHFLCHSARLPVCVSGSIGFYLIFAKANQSQNLEIFTFTKIKICLYFWCLNEFWFYYTIIRVDFMWLKRTHRNFNKTESKQYLSHLVEYKNLIAIVDFFKHLGFWKWWNRCVCILKLLVIFE